jgi:hypothetical protein
MVVIRAFAMAKDGHRSVGQFLSEIIESKERAHSSDIFPRTSSFSMKDVVSLLQNVYTYEILNASHENPLHAERFFTSLSNVRPQFLCTFSSLFGSFRSQICTESPHGRSPGQ